METTRRSGVVILLVFAALVESQNGNLDCNGRSSLCVGPLIYKTCEDNGNGQMVTNEEPEKMCPENTRCDNEGETSCVPLKATSMEPTDETITSEYTTTDATTLSDVTEVDMNNQSSNNLVHPANESYFENSNDTSRQDIENETKSNNETTNEPLSELGETTTELSSTTVETTTVENENQTEVSSPSEDREPTNEIESIPNTSSDLITSDIPEESETLNIDESYNEQPTNDIDVQSANDGEMIVDTTTTLSNETSDQKTNETSTNSTQEETRNEQEKVQTPAIITPDEKIDENSNSNKNESSSTDQMSQIPINDVEPPAQPTETEGTEDIHSIPSTAESSSNTSASHNEISEEPSESTKDRPSSIPEGNEPDQPLSIPLGEDGLTNNNIEQSDIISVSSVDEVSSGSPTEDQSSGSQSSNLPTDTMDEGDLHSSVGAPESSVPSADIPQSEASASDQASNNGSIVAGTSTTANKPVEDFGTEDQQPSDASPSIQNASAQGENIGSEDSHPLIGDPQSSVSSAGTPEGEATTSDQVSNNGANAAGTNTAANKPVVDLGTEDQQSSDASPNIQNASAQGENIGSEDSDPSIGAPESSVSSAGTPQGEASTSDQASNNEVNAAGTNTAANKPVVDLGTESQQPSDASPSIQNASAQGENIGTEDSHPSIGAPESNVSSGGIPQGEVTTLEQTSANGPTVPGIRPSSTKPAEGVENGSQQSSDVSKNIESASEQGENVGTEDQHPELGTPVSNVGSAGTPQGEATTSDQTSAKRPTPVGTNTTATKPGIGLQNESEQPSNDSSNIQGPSEQGENVASDGLHPSFIVPESSGPSDGSPQNTETTSDGTSNKVPTAVGTSTIMTKPEEGLGNEGQQPSDASLNTQEPSEQGENVDGGNLHPSFVGARPNMPSAGTPEDEGTISEQTSANDLKPSGTSATATNSEVGLGSQSQQPSDGSPNTQSEHSENVGTEDRHPSVGAPGVHVPSVGTTEGDVTTSDQTSNNRPTASGTSTTATKPGTGFGNENQQPSVVYPNIQDPSEQGESIPLVDSNPSFITPTSSASKPVAGVENEGQQSSDVSLNTPSFSVPESSAGTPQGEGTTSDQATVNEPTATGTRPSATRPGVGLGHGTQQHSDVSPNIESESDQGENVGSEDLHPSFGAPESSVASAGTPQGEPSTSDQTTANGPTATGTKPSATRPGVGLGNGSQEHSDVYPNIESTSNQGENVGSEDLHPAFGVPELSVPNVGSTQGEATASDQTSANRPNVAETDASDVAQNGASPGGQVDGVSSTTGLHSPAPLSPSASSHLPGQLPSLVSGPSAGIPIKPSLDKPASSETSEEGVESPESIESNESILSNESASVDNEKEGSLTKENSENVSSSSDESLQNPDNNENENRPSQGNKSTDSDESPESKESSKKLNGGGKQSARKNKSEESMESPESIESSQSKKNKKKSTENNKSDKSSESSESRESSENKENEKRSVEDKKSKKSKESIESDESGKKNNSSESSESSEINESEEAKDKHRNKSRKSSESRNSSSSEEHDSKEKKKFECTGEGHFPDPDSCKKYYICSLNEKSKLKKYHLKCHSHHIYNLEKAECVHDHKKCD